MLKYNHMSVKLPPNELVHSWYTLDMNVKLPPNELVHSWYTLEWECSIMGQHLLASLVPRLWPEVLIDISCHMMDGMRLMEESENQT